MDEQFRRLTSTLWPDSAAVKIWTRGTDIHRFVAVPHAHRPTQILPYGLASVRATATRPSDFRPRLRQWREALGVAGLLSVATVSRSHRFAMRTDAGSIVEHVRDQFERSITAAIVLLGPPRANQKPVLQLHNRRGQTVAFAKVAWNEITTQLLADEHNALTYLNLVPQPGFCVPKVLGAASFGEGSYLLLSPVSVSNRVRASKQRAMDLALAIERTSPGSVSRVTDSPFVDRLLQRSRDLPIAHGIVHNLTLRHAERDLPLRAWHGDFVPWNFLSGSKTMAVWDWERFDQAVPAGFDRLHYSFQLASHRDPSSIGRAVATVRAELSDVLPELDSVTADAHLDWYLAEVLCRYEHDSVMVDVPDLAVRIRALAAAMEQREASR